MFESQPQRSDLTLDEPRPGQAFQPQDWVKNRFEDIESGYGLFCVWL